jgi:hypothetical protein
MRIKAMNKRQDTVDRLRTLHAQVWTWLQSIPGIAGLGIGVNGWRVYVESGFHVHHRDSPGCIPREIAHFPTEIVLKQASFACYGDDFQPLLKPGIQIKAKGQGDGSLGCFARLTAAPNTIVMLSNRHVLYGDVADFGSSGDGNDCGQPSVSCCCCCASHVIGQNRGNGVNGFDLVVVKVTHPQNSGTFTGSDIDCAVAVLNGKRPYTNQSEFYGMITGTPATGLGVSAGDTVEKVGATTGHTKGTICEFNTSAVYQRGGTGAVPNILWPYPMVGDFLTENSAGATGNINMFFVIPEADASNPSRKTQFADGGDSGAVVVNSAKQVIGIITRTVKILNQDGIDYLNQFLTTPLPPHAGTLGAVCPIGKVLDSLGIEIVNNMQGTVTTAGPVMEVPDEVVRECERVMALERTLQSLELEIRRKAVGREVVDKIGKHRPEAARLVERNRAVKVAWHRGQGPAYAAHCLHSFQDRGYEIPSQVNGVTPQELVRRMAQVLKTYGSEGLQSDIREYEQLALEWIEGCNSVWQLVDRLRKWEPAGGTNEVEVTAEAGVFK